MLSWDNTNNSVYDNMDDNYLKCLYVNESQVKRDLLWEDNLDMTTILGFFRVMERWQTYMLFKYFIKLKTPIIYRCP